jgi:hypothetical protein
MRPDADRDQLIPRVPLERAGAIAGEIAIRVNGSTHVGRGLTLRAAGATVQRHPFWPTSIHQMTVTPYLRNTRSADTIASWS